MRSRLGERRASDFPGSDQLAGFGEVRPPSWSLTRKAGITLGQGLAQRGDQQALSEQAKIAKIVSSRHRAQDPGLPCFSQRGSFFIFSNPDLPPFPHLLTRKAIVKSVSV